MTGMRRNKPPRASNFAPDRERPDQTLSGPYPANQNRPFQFYQFLLSFRMATADQIKALIRSHWSDEPERFFTTALQVAAHEARQGHGALATEIKEMVDDARRRDHQSKILSFPVELERLISREEPRTALPALVLPKTLEDRIAKVLSEYRQRDKLRAHNLSPRRKLLLTGPPGTGKTMTAKVLPHDC